jgi:hypothetical protein
MQESTPSDWEREVTPVRWAARLLSIGAVVFEGYWVASTVRTGFSLEVVLAVVLSLLGVGLLIAVVWIGIGEVLGGIALVFGSVGLAFLDTIGCGIFSVGVAIAVGGALFIVSGWYTLVHRPHPTPTTTRLSGSN